MAKFDQDKMYFILVTLRSTNIEVEIPGFPKKHLEMIGFADGCRCPSKASIQEYMGMDAR